MSIGPIEALGGFTPMVPNVLPTAAPSVGNVGGVDGVDKASSIAGAAGPDFGQILSQGIENLQNVHDRADSLAVQAATGDLTAIHDYTITATEAAVATQLTTAVRNKALEAFQEIMRMSI
jgi:flagellar hook-basal body complex protein FliE